MKLLTPALVALALACVTFFYFPGHTWLQQDTQVYAPILERLRDPAALAQEPLAARPHVSFTLYDETAVALAAATGAPFEHVLGALQVAARAFGIWALYRLALAALAGCRGRRRVALAWVAAAACSLGAQVAGPQVLTLEYEPTPRAFALPLALCVAACAAHRRWRGAGWFAAAAVLLHAPTAAPVWGVALAVAARRGRPALWRVAWPGASAALGLGLMAWWQGGGGEQGLFARLEPWLEQLQRMRASYNWVSSWSAATLWHHVVVAGLAAAALARVWRRLRPELRWFLVALPAAGLLSMPVSWGLLEGLKLAALPQLQPMRMLLFGALALQLASAVAGAWAARGGRVAEACGWFTLAALPAAQPLLTAGYRPRALAGAALAGLILGAAAWLASRRAPLWAWLAAAAWAALPVAGGVVNYPDLHSPELSQLCLWAAASTPKDSVFAFPDSGKGLEPGVFRAQATRAVYVDWKGGGQVNYLPGFARLWSERWQAARGNRMAAARLPELGARGVRFVALRKRLPRTAVFENGQWAVYELER